MKTTCCINLFLLGYFCNLISAQNEIPGYGDSFKNHQLILQADNLAEYWKWEEAEEIYSSALEHFEFVENWEAYLYCLNRLGGIYNYLGDKSKAHDLLSRSLELVAVHFNQSHPEAARAYFYLAEIYINGDSLNYLQAKHFAELSLELREKISPVPNIELADSFEQLARFYRVTDAVSQSIENYESALKIYHEVLDSSAFRLGEVYRQYGLSLRNGHYTRLAIEYRFAALEIFKRDSSTPDEALSHAYQNNGTMLFEEKRYSEAVPYFENAIRYMESTFGPNSNELCIALISLGSTYGYLNQIEKARSYFNRAIETNKALTDPNTFYLSISYEQLADVLEYNRQLDSSYYYSKKALSLVLTDEQSSMIQESGLYLSCAEYHLRTKSLDSAEIYTLLSMSLHDPKFDLVSDTFPTITQTPYPDILYKSLGKLAQIYFEKYVEHNSIGDLKSSIRAYAKLDEFSDRLRNELYSEQTKLSMAGYYKSDAADAIRAIYEYGRISNSNPYIRLAFQFIEKNRYAKIYENRIKATELARSVLPDSLRQVELALLSTMEEYRFQLIESSTDSIKNIIQSRIFDLERTYSRYQRTVSESFPNYFETDYKDMLSVTDVQKKLLKRSQIIEYFWADSLLYILSITKRNSFLHEIPISTELVDHIFNFVNAISHLDINSEDKTERLHPNYFASVGFELKNALLSDYISHKTNHLIISADGPLSFLPFEALSTNQHAENWRDVKYLLYDYDFQYVYNTNLLFTTYKKKPAKPKIIAMAFTDISEKASIDADPRTLNSLPEIIASSYEVDAIKNEFIDHEVLILKGEEATESRFKQMAENYDIIHLAVHGIGDTSNELNSSLHFKTQFDFSDNGRLNAHEIYELNLHDTRLTVLSACQSGIGMEIQGEGVFSVARGFAYAGCPSMVMSLWNVNDVQTARLMAHFYNRLEAGVSVHSALKTAKLAFLEEAESEELLHPYYWASFIHLGISQEMVPASNFMYLVISLVSILILIIVARKFG